MGKPNSAKPNPANQNRNIAQKRSNSMCNHFVNVINKRTIFLLSQYPFMLIGTVENVIEDYVQIEADTSIIEVFEQRTWFVHIDTIQAFYDEEEGSPQIPTLN